MLLNILALQHYLIHVRNDRYDLYRGIEKIRVSFVVMAQFVRFTLLCDYLINLRTARRGFLHSPRMVATSTQLISTP